MTSANVCAAAKDSFAFDREYAPTILPAAFFHRDATIPCVATDAPVDTDAATEIEAAGGVIDGDESDTAICGVDGAESEVRRRRSRVARSEATAKWMT